MAYTLNLSNSVGINGAYLSYLLSIDSIISILFIKFIAIISSYSKTKIR